MTARIAGWWFNLGVLYCINYEITSAFWMVI